MSLSSIALASFLVLFGAITAFGVAFVHSNVVVGVLAVVAGVLLFARK